MKNYFLEKTNRCLECDCYINDNVHFFSVQNYFYPLCINHQRWFETISQRTTHFTIKLYFELKIRNIKCEIEKFDGYKTIDIAIPKAKLNIEVDGSHHNLDVFQAMADLKRTFHSLMKDDITIRIPNCLTKDDRTIRETADHIAELAYHLKQKHSKNFTR